MIRRPPRSTHCISSAASDVYKRQYQRRVHGGRDGQSEDEERQEKRKRERERQTIAIREGRETVQAPMNEAFIALLQVRHYVKATSAMNWKKKVGYPATRQTAERERGRERDKQNSTENRPQGPRVAADRRQLAHALAL
eukprot:TRINITY_DN18917_c0_g1_i1.p4 TRINITY_DN18917_c0_g1~~TRINITY_DN18917_c0_g1_i1.p4  ORF type:complete len:139 (+),score=14.14 TRINITY_DN18917_c0_g1_i1:67-483(+)